MDPGLLLHECRRRGIELRAVGGRLIAKGARSSIVGPIAVLLSQQEAQLISFLQTKQADFRPLRPLQKASGRSENTDIQAEKYALRPLRPLRPLEDEARVSFSPTPNPVGRREEQEGDGGGEIVTGCQSVPASGRSGREGADKASGTVSSDRPPGSAEWTEWPGSSPSGPRPELTWRPIVGAWPIALRQRWGDLANELMLAGMPWPTDEAEAFRLVCEQARPEELP
jgi:hypothetical protein